MNIHTIINLTIPLDQPLLTHSAAVIDGLLNTFPNNGFKKFFAFGNIIYIIYKIILITDKITVKRIFKVCVIISSNICHILLINPLNAARIFPPTPFNAPPALPAVLATAITVPAPAAPAAVALTVSLMDESSFGCSAVCSKISFPL
jgi:hypothetical protein